MIAAAFRSLEVLQQAVGHSRIHGLGVRIRNCFHGVDQPGQPVRGCRRGRVVNTALIRYPALLHGVVFAAVC